MFSQIYSYVLHVYKASLYPMNKKQDFMDI